MSVNVVHGGSADVGVLGLHAQSLSAACRAGLAKFESGRGVFRVGSGPLKTLFERQKMASKTLVSRFDEYWLTF